MILVVLAYSEELATCCCRSVENKYDSWCQANVPGAIAVIVGLRSACAGSLHHIQSAWAK